ncbi:alpha-L-rhamnosidase N-terminal domain-containing protein [Streptomyces sp. NPDC002920]
MGAARGRIAPSTTGQCSPVRPTSANCCARGRTPSASRSAAPASPESWSPRRSGPRNRVYLPARHHPARRQDAAHRHRRGLAHGGRATADRMFFGEHHDARAEEQGWATPSYDASSWQAAPEQPAPTRRVVPALMPPVTITDTFGPVTRATPVYAPVGRETQLYDDPSWPGMLVPMPWTLHQHYGDLAVPAGQLRGHGHLDGPHGRSHPQDR